MAKFGWRQGYPQRIPVESAGKALMALKKKHGESLTASVVVDEASDSSHPLHKQIFHLDTEKAARSHYEAEARHLLRTVYWIDRDKPERQVPVFTSVNVERESTRVYLDTKDALKNPEYREQILTRAMRDLERFQKQYSDLEELSELIDHMETERQRRAA